MSQRITRRRTEPHPQSHQNQIEFDSTAEAAGEAEAAAVQYASMDLREVRTMAARRTFPFLRIRLLCLLPHRRCPPLQRQPPPRRCRRPLALVEMRRSPLLTPAQMRMAMVKGRGLYSTFLRAEMARSCSVRATDGYAPRTHARTVSSLLSTALHLRHMCCTCA